MIAVGRRVKHLQEGDRTLVPFLHPTWAERLKTNTSWLRPLPAGDVKQFAMLGVNPPTAYLPLTEIVKIIATLRGDSRRRKFGRRPGSYCDREIAWFEGG